VTLADEDTNSILTFCIVNVNFVQLKDACDQSRMVETCCAKENKIDIEKGFFVVVV